MCTRIITKIRLDHDGNETPRPNPPAQLETKEGPERITPSISPPPIVEGEEDIEPAKVNEGVLEATDVPQPKQESLSPVLRPLESPVAADVVSTAAIIATKLTCVDTGHRARPTMRLWRWLTILTLGCRCSKTFQLLHKVLSQMCAESSSTSSCRHLSSNRPMTMAWICRQDVLQLLCQRARRSMSDQRM